jgi:hypothetical protein
MLFEGGKKPVQDARGGASQAMSREGVGEGIRADSSACQSCFLVDAAKGLTGGMPPANVIVEDLPAIPSVRPRCDLSRRARVRLQALLDRRRPLDRGQPAQAWVDPGESTLDHLTGVQEQMPAVRDLSGLARSDRGASGIVGGPIARHDAELGVLPEPGRQGRCRAIGQELDGPPSFQVHDDRAVAPPLAQGPVIDADHRGPFGRGDRQPPQCPQHRRRAGRHAEGVQKPSRRAAAERETSPDVGCRETARSLRVTRGQVSQRLGEGSASAVEVATVEPPYGDANGDGLTGDRQISDATPVAAVDRRAPTFAAGAASMSAAAHQVSDEDGRAMPRPALDAEAWEVDGRDHRPEVRGASRPTRGEAPRLHETRRRATAMGADQSRLCSSLRRSGPQSSRTRAVASQVGSQAS